MQIGEFKRRSEASPCSLTQFIDAASVFSGGRLMRFSSTMMSYGYFGDLMERSEARRWLGPSRYDVCGAQTWAAGRAYRGAVGYVEAVDPSRPGDHPSQRRLCTSDCEGRRFARGFFCITTDLATFITLPI